MVQNPGMPTKSDPMPNLPQPGLAFKWPAAMKRFRAHPPASWNSRTALTLLLCLTFLRGTSTPFEHFHEFSDIALLPNAEELVLPLLNSKIDHSEPENKDRIWIKERAENLSPAREDGSWGILTPIQPGETKAGNIATAGQVDSYQFSAQSGEFVTILMQSNGSVRTILELHGPDGSVLTTAGGNAFSAYIQAFRLTQTGTHLILCRSYAFTGSYAVTLVKNPGPNVADPDGGTILPGETKAGELGVADIDVFDFTGQSGEFVTILMQSNGSVRTILELHGPDGSVLTTAGGTASAPPLRISICRSRGST